MRETIYSREIIHETPSNRVCGKLEKHVLNAKNDFTRDGNLKNIKLCNMLKIQMEVKF